MEWYRPRKLMFKAWNKETRLLMRLDNIRCIKGELKKKDHVLLQFTGLQDKQEEDLYELDILLLNTEKFIILWDAATNGWALCPLSDPARVQPLLRALALQGTRLRSYFESQPS
jgi:hypothetical protein